MKVTDIQTKMGNEILKSLVKSNGWRIQSQYDESAFDKGIDFDSYIIEKSGEELHFEWTNWLEWEIVGEASLIKQLSKQYGFNIINE